MAMDYLKKLDDLRERMRQKAEETDRKYNITSKLDEAVKTAEIAARKGADAARVGIDAARRTAEQIPIDPKLRTQAREAATAANAAANEAARVATDAAKVASDSVVSGARVAKDQALDFFGDAKQYYRAASGAASAGYTAAATTATLASAVASARKWVVENPGKATVVTLSLLAGAGAGAAWPGLDVVVLGAGSAGHWLFHSAAGSYGMYRLSDKYMAYVKERERLLAEGKLGEAERKRVEFQRNAAKYVGAPLLGAFSVAAGATLMYEAFTGGVVVGFPINLVLGGNPLLSSVWLFGNGLVCFHNGYKFFMMALAKEEDVARVINDLKGLLPAAVAS
jgi:polyhydroxyalkanoate synthesis regulator phasin